MAWNISHYLIVKAEVSLIVKTDEKVHSPLALHPSISPYPYLNPYYSITMETVIRQVIGKMENDGVEHITLSNC
jgi:hypothetical protein